MTAQLNFSQRHSSALPSMRTSYEIPHLRKTKTSSQLIVNGEPFLILGGELHNSSFSNAEFMQIVYPNMNAMNVNFLLGSVTWEMIEPIEGLFDFSELDKVILGAREHGMRLGSLWFGSFKNALSTYIPGWVKKDIKRIPRVHVEDLDGNLKTIELLLPFNQRAWEADARAFAALMKHIGEFDCIYSTVIIIQDQNETGLLEDSMDRSKIAKELFKQPMPGDILTMLKSKPRQPIFSKPISELPRRA
jgi:beta-galactosidase GanA